MLNSESPLREVPLYVCMGVRVGCVICKYNVGGSLVCCVCVGELHYVGMCEYMCVCSWV